MQINYIQLTTEERENIINSFIKGEHEKWSTYFMNEFRLKDLLIPSNRTETIPSDPTKKISNVEKYNFITEVVTPIACIINEASSVDRIKIYDTFIKSKEGISILKFSSMNVYEFLNKHLCLSGAILSHFIQNRSDLEELIMTLSKKERDLFCMRLKEIKDNDLHKFCYYYSYIIETDTYEFHENQEIVFEYSKIQTDSLLDEDLHEKYVQELNDRMDISNIIIYVISAFKHLNKLALTLTDIGCISSILKNPFALYLHNFAIPDGGYNYYEYKKQQELKNRSNDYIFDPTIDTEKRNLIKQAIINFYNEIDGGNKKVTGKAQLSVVRLLSDNKLLFKNETDMYKPEIFNQMKLFIEHYLKDFKNIGLRAYQGTQSTFQEEIKEKLTPETNPYKKLEIFLKFEKEISNILPSE